jgi:hypothetical protein
LWSLTTDEFFGILFKASTAAMRSSTDFSMSRMVFFSCWRLSHLLFTSLSRFFCFAMEDFFAISVPFLFPARRPFLALLAVGIFLIDHIDPPSSADDLIPF